MGGGVGGGGGGGVGGGGGGRRRGRLGLRLIHHQGLHRTRNGGVLSVLYNAHDVPENIEHGKHRDQAYDSDQDGLQNGSSAVCFELLVRLIFDLRLYQRAFLFVEIIKVFVIVPHISSSVSFLFESAGFRAHILCLALRSGGFGQLILCMCVS